VVTVPPPNPVTLFVGDTFTDPAVTATDNIDPNPTITPSGTVNTVIVGMYTRTYTAADSVGNMASEDLTVNVVLPPAPALALDPNDIDFGDTVVGETSTAETITVRNDGTADLTVSMINATTAPFTLDASGTCTAVPFTLIPGSDCTVAYTFSPTVTGAANQSINVTSNADSSPDTLSLAGNGIQPGIALDPNDIDFGDTMVGETSTSETVTVRNDGTADLTVSMIEAATAPFTLDASGTCTAVPFTLTPGSDCTVAYTFSPTVTGAADQSINVTSNSDTSPDTLSLAGNGILLDRSFTGPLPSGNTGTLSFDTDDISCEFSEDPMFLSGSAAGEPPPASINLIDGITSFRITDCTPGATVELTMEYGDTLPAGAQYWKEGDPWRRIAASVTATSFTFSITDGGPNDDDGIVNGEIVDPSGAAQVRATPPTPVPANPAWLLALLYLAIIGLAQAGGLSRHARRHR
ncbi:MAG: choice-of-anchor D domain-containing protein, partial [Halieaceae bacterium]